MADSKGLPPPVNQDARENDQESTQRDNEKYNVPTLKSATGNGQQEERKPEKTEATQPEKNRRIKRCCVWIKRNFFNLMLTIFTGLYAFGFLYDAYITKRAYVVPEKKPGDRAAIIVLPNDAGIQMSFRNTGMTPATDGVFQAWVLKEKQVVQIEEIDRHAIRRTIAAGHGVSISVRWVDAPQDIALVRKEEIAFRVIARLRYKDVFGIVHCEEFAAQYEHDPWGEFTETVTVPVCDSTVRSVRFNRVCVPSADKTFGVWVETLETFDSPDPGVPIPENDPAPCYNKN